MNYACKHEVQQNSGSNSFQTMNRWTYHKCWKQLYAGRGGWL